MKWLGMCMVFLGCMGLGIWYSALYTRRFKNLVSCRKAVLIIRGEIAYGRTPLPQAFFQAAGRVRGAVKEFFLLVADRMEEGGARLEKIWSQALQETISDREMRKEDIRELRELGDTLGYLDAQMQLQILDLYLNRLEQSMQEYEAEKKSRARLYPVLGTMCGMLICIIIL